LAEGGAIDSVSISEVRKPLSTMCRRQRIALGASVRFMHRLNEKSAGCIQKVRKAVETGFGRSPRNMIGMFTDNETTIAAASRDRSITEFRTFDPESEQVVALQNQAK
jgi:hypothetical protein